MLAEYETYASPKARADDIAFIKAFDPESVYAFAKTRGFLDQRGLRRIDSSISNIDMLAEALASGYADSDSAVTMGSRSTTVSSVGSSNTISGDVIMEQEFGLPMMNAATTIEGVEVDGDEQVETVDEATQAPIVSVRSMSDSDNSDAAESELP